MLSNYYTCPQVPQERAASYYYRSSVLIRPNVSSYCCTRVHPHRFRRSASAPSYYYVRVYSSMRHTEAHVPPYVSSYYCIRVHTCYRMCPHNTPCVLWCSRSAGTRSRATARYTCVLILLYTCVLRCRRSAGAHSRATATQCSSRRRSHSTPPSAPLRISISRTQVIR